MCYYSINKYKLTCFPSRFISLLLSALLVPRAPLVPQLPLSLSSPCPLGSSCHFVKVTKWSFTPRATINFNIYRTSRSDILQTLNKKVNLQFGFYLIKQFIQNFSVTLVKRCNNEWHEQKGVQTIQTIHKLNIIIV